MDASTSLSADLGERLLGLGAQVTTAESCTGGGIAEAITRIAGSSAWFEAGYITYSNTQKTAQLQVPTELFEQVGAVSREVVEAMVRGAQQHSRARFAVAVSGVAGPGGGSADKPVGTVWLAWADGTRPVQPARAVCRRPRCRAPANRGRCASGFVTPCRWRKTVSGVGEGRGMWNNTGYLYRCSGRQALLIT